jgi:hypothetical protein
MSTENQKNDQNIHIDNLPYVVVAIKELTKAITNCTNKLTSQIEKSAKASDKLSLILVFLTAVLAFVGVVQLIK